MNNFYILYGSDTSKLEYEANKILEKLKITDPVKYDLLTTPIEDVIEDAATIGMFQKEKALILENSLFLCANKTIPNLEKLSYYIEHYNKNSYLIFLCPQDTIDTRKKITKQLSKYEIKNVSTKKVENLGQYVLEILNQDGFQMEDIPFFLSRVGSNFSNIENELEKLKMYTLQTKKITNNDVEKVTTKVIEDEIFALTDAIILKDTKKALELLNEFLNLSYDEIQILSLLASQFHFLFQVKRLQNKNKSEAAIAKILEANPYRVKYTAKKLYQYTEEDILKEIKMLAKADHDIKLGLMDKNLALKLLIMHKKN